MTNLLFLYDSLLAFATIFVCIGCGMFFLRKAAGGEVGPGYWAIGFFLNSAGFLFWAGTVTSKPWLFFIIGEVCHMLGFILLACGAYRFTGKGFQRWNMYALGGLAVAWLGAMSLMPYHRSGSFSLLMVLRAVLFLWAGRMILRHISTKSVAGRRLAGWGLVVWGIYVLLFPIIWRLPWLVPLAIGFLVGLHVLAAMGMVVLIVDRMRIRAEASETLARRLEGLLPICSQCKKIRDGHDNWHSMELFIEDHSEAEFTHSICPECAKSLYPDLNIYDESE